jgi:hypothetical protein
VARPGRRAWRGKTVGLTKAAVQPPWPPVDAEDDRRLLEHCCIQEAQQPGEVGHPPQNHARAVRVPVVFTVRLWVVATA